MKNRILLIILSLILIGCVPNYNGFVPSKKEHKAIVICSFDKIEVYRSKKPKEHYIELGILNYQGAIDLKEIITKMKNDASKLGGNAIIDLKLMQNGAVGTLIKIDRK